MSALGSCFVVVTNRRRKRPAGPGSAEPATGPRATWKPWFASVAAVRCRLEVPLVEVMVPQHHPLGEEAEVHFGTISVYLAGVLVEVSMFVMRLSASGRAYPRAYLNEAQEVFLDEHVRAFEHSVGSRTGSATTTSRRRSDEC